MCSRSRRIAHARALAILALLVSSVALHVGAGGAAAADPSLAIDAGTQGNTATSVGTIENCIAVKTGDEFQVDIVVQNISNLLAWEIHLGYDPAVVEVTDQNVKLFQQANAGSSVIDVSGHVPDDSGLHALSAFDSSDPATPDSGSGILSRVTFKALAPGTSPIRFGSKDLNGDGKLDVGTLLRDTNGSLIGDLNGDGFFDGAQQDAQVAVDGSCPAGSVVAQGPEDAATGTSFPWLIVSGGAGVFVVVLGAVGLTVFSRRRRARRTPPNESS
jgi:Cohesin domain